MKPIYINLRDAHLQLELTRLNVFPEDCDPYIKPRWYYTLNIHLSHLK